MGIVYQNLRFLGEAKKQGVSFESTLTIGRQYLFASEKDISRLIAKFPAPSGILKYKDDEFADRLLREFLGVKELNSIDYSDYEGATIIHDMNQPLPASLHEKFDAVIDGGSLEHIFDVKTALSNYMSLVKKDGSLFIFTTANNHMGHGFYQFSPELFFNVFREENGFDLREAVLHEHSFPGVELDSGHSLYKISDPFEVKSRVGLVSRKPAMIMIHAVRNEIKPFFARSPVQSDYQARHKGEKVKEETFVRKIFSRLPKALQDYLHGKRQLGMFSVKNKRFYRRIND